jgi:hypothetical protein
MYCTYCGRETSGLINYCSSCGYNLNSQRDLRYATFPQAYTEVRSQESRKGIGGWLMFFCVLITVVAPLLLFIDWHADRLSFVRTMFGLVTGIMVWSIRPTALNWLRGYFVIGIVTRVAALILISTKANVNDGHWFEHFANQCMGLFILTAWIAYFNFSARVKATFGSNL